MHLISAEGYKNANAAFLTIKTTSEIWLSKKDVGSGIGVKNKYVVFAKQKIFQKNKLMIAKWQKDKLIKSLLI